MAAAVVVCFRPPVVPAVARRRPPRHPLRRGTRDGDRPGGLVLHPDHPGAVPCPADPPGQPWPSRWPRSPVLAVAMPHTAGAADLPGAEAEAGWLQRHFPGEVNVLTGPKATHDAVLVALPAARLAHFACHGSSDLANPSASRLLLADHQRRPLTVIEVARLRLDDADLAFLSACSTGRPSGRLTDEAIHMASAFQLAGYRQVIATLWRVGDQDAVDIATDIYTTLNSATGDAARAAHAATRRFRRRWPDSPSIWASHIHSGA